MNKDIETVLADALIDARWDPPEAREIGRDLAPAVERLLHTSGDTRPEVAADVQAMLLPLRTWLSRAGFGQRRAQAARQALDDFVTALAADDDGGE